MSTLTTASAAVKHRGKSPRELRAEVTRLERENQEFACKFTELGRAYLDLRDLFDEAGIDLSGALEDVRVADERADKAEQLKDEEHTELVGLRARVANLDPWNVPVIGVRDSDPDGQATHPIDVRQLRAEHTGPWRPVIHLSQAPFAAPGPVADVDHRSLSARFMAGETVVRVSGGPFATTPA